jgi:hypothetical protein
VTLHPRRESMAQQKEFDRPTKEREALLKK